MGLAGGLMLLALPATAQTVGRQSGETEVRNAKRAHGKTVLKSGKEVSTDQLKQAIEGQHGGKAALVEALPVKEVFQGQTVWEGVVHVFDLDGHSKATRAYAWSSLVEGSTKRRFYAVLHLGGIRSPLDAVRAAIVAERRERSGK